MNNYFTPYPYRMTRRWARMAECEQPEHSHSYTLSVDIREQDDVYVLSALVPGLKAEELNIQILEDVVTVEGEFKADQTEYLMRELPHGSFRRTLRLPATLDAEKAQAKITDGVLTLHLPKAESSRPKTIKVAVK
jgi:HSP20 family protein